MLYTVSDKIILLQSQVKISGKPSSITYADVVYTNGDKFYYHRKNVNRWSSSAVVLGKDGQLVLVCHGGAYYYAHPCQLTKMQDSSTCQTKIDK